MDYAGRDRVRGSDPTGEPRDSAKRETMQNKKGRGPTDVETGQETAEKVQTEKEKETYHWMGHKWRDRGAEEWLKQTQVGQVAESDSPGE